MADQAETIEVGGLGDRSLDRCWALLRDAGVQPRIEAVQVGDHRDKRLCDGCGLRSLPTQIGDRALGVVCGCAPLIGLGSGCSDRACTTEASRAGGDSRGALSDPVRGFRTTQQGRCWAGCRRSPQQFRAYRQEHVLDQVLYAEHRKTDRFCK